jgi:hypothetical protein
MWPASHPSRLLTNFSKQAQQLQSVTTQHSNFQSLQYSLFALLSLLVASLLSVCTLLTDGFHTSKGMYKLSTCLLSIRNLCSGDNGGEKVAGLMEDTVKQYHFFSVHYRLYQCWGGEGSSNGYGALPDTIA